MCMGLTPSYSAQYYFNQLGAPLFIVIKEYDYTLLENQNAIAKLASDVGSAPMVVAPIFSWLSAFKLWLTFCHFPPVPAPVGDQFYTLLREFVNEPECCKQLPSVCGFSHQPDIIFGDDGRIVTSRLRGYHKPTWNTTQVLFCPVFFGEEYCVLIMWLHSSCLLLLPPAL